MKIKRFLTDDAGNDTQKTFARAFCFSGVANAKSALFDLISSCSVIFYPGNVPFRFETDATIHGGVNMKIACANFGALFEFSQSIINIQM